MFIVLHYTCIKLVFITSSERISEK